MPPDPERPPTPGARRASGSPEELLQKLAKVDEAEAVLSGRRYYVVIVPEADLPTCDEHDTFDGLLRQVSSLVGTKVFIFVFCGERWKVSKPPYRYLVGPGDKMVPLFMPPTGELEFDDLGDLSTPPPPEPGPEAPQPRALDV